MGSKAKKRLAVSAIEWARHEAEAMGNALKLSELSANARAMIASLKLSREVVKNILLTTDAKIAETMVRTASAMNDYMARKLNVMNLIAQSLAISADIAWRESSGKSEERVKDAKSGQYELARVAMIEISEELAKKYNLAAKTVTQYVSAATTMLWGSSRKGSKLAFNSALCARWMKLDPSMNWGDDSVGTYFNKSNKSKRSKPKSDAQKKQAALESAHKQAGAVGMMEYALAQDDVGPAVARFFEIVTAKNIVLPAGFAIVNNNRKRAARKVARR